MNTTGWENYANEPSQAALERSSQDAQDVIKLTPSKAAVWTVDDVARLIEFLFIKTIFIYFYPRQHMIMGDRSQNSTLKIIYYMNIQNVRPDGSP